MGNGSTQKTKACGLTLERDRGYAWVILAVCYLPQMVSIGCAYSVAVLQQAWIEEFQGTYSLAVISAVGSINVAALFSAGPLAGFLIHKLGHRYTVLIGGLLTTAGYVIR